MRILEKENIQLIASLEQLRIYNSNINKRRLINARSAKHCLVKQGVLDADDAQRINEQL